MLLLSSIYEGLLQLAALIPLLLFSRRSFQKGNKKYTVVFCIIFLLNTVITISLNVRLFAGQNWNWVGKSATLLLALLFIFFTRYLTKKEMGFTGQVQQPQSSCTIVVAFLMFRLGMHVASQGWRGSYHTETFLYQATLPGLSEEFIFRGILLGLLNKVFIPSWTFLKTRFGWGLIITSVLFGYTHGLFTNNWIPSFNSQRFLTTFGLGFLLGFVKEKGKSLVPAVLLHNGWNLIVYAGK